MIKEKQKDILEKLLPYAVGLLLGLGISSLVGLVAVTVSPHTTTPIASPLIIRKDALTPPTGWDYKYAYNTADEVFDFTKYSNGFHTDIEYTWTADGAYSNYSTSFPVSENASPFPISLTFRHSNTTWQPFHENTYVPVSTSIGSDSTVGSVAKQEFVFTNSTKHVYQFYIDISSTGSARQNVLWVDNLLQHYITFTNASLSVNKVIINAYSVVKFTMDSSSSSFYFDAFYLDDLGVSTAYTNGYNAGYNAGYSAGYDVGFYAGYDSGYDYGYDVGYESGEDTGYDAGYSAGYTLGYSEGSDFGYTQHELDGGIMGFIGRVLDTVGTFLNIEVFEGITLGALILWPLVLAVIFFMLKMYKSGD